MNFSLVKKILLHFFLGGAFITMFALAFGSPREGLAVLKTFIFNGLLWVALAFGNGYATDSTDRFYSWIKDPGKKFILVTISSIIVTTIIGYTFLYIYLYIFSAITFEEANKIFFTEMLPGLISITFVVAMFYHGKAFLNNWKRSELETEKLKKANISSQYEALKNQVNPHFLFNSLNVLSTLVYKDQDLAVDFINKLSSFYRYVLEVQKKEVVPLKQELKELNNFIFLLRKRFGNNLNIEIDDFDDDEQMLVPLSLQMLVENAVKHNVISKSKPLNLRIKNDNGYISVENDLNRKDQNLESMGIGLPNIKSRYEYLTEKAIEVIENSTSFIVKLPILKLDS